MKTHVAEMILYMYPGACSRVTMTALEEIGLSYETGIIDLGAGVQNGADYLALNHKGKVPMLSIGGAALTENAAILGFLDSAYPTAKLLPRSNKPLETAVPLSDLIWCSSTLHVEVRQIRNPFKMTAGESAGVRASGLTRFASNCAYISSRLEGERWWYGADWSILDTYLYWAYSTAAKGGFPLNDFPTLVAHSKRVRERPSFKRMLARELAAVEQGKLNVDPASL